MAEKKLKIYSWPTGNIEIHNFSQCAIQIRGHWSDLWAVSLYKLKEGIYIKTESS